MKPLALLTAGSLAFATPLLAAEGAATPAAEVAANAIPVTTVLVKGGGWGAGKRVRAALDKQEGIKKLVLSGLRATLIMESGACLDQGSLKDDLKAGKLELVSITEEKLALPESAYTLAVTGTTWAATNDKARLALEKLPEIEVACVDNGITLYMADGAAPDKEALTKLLAEYKMKVSEVKKAEDRPF